MSKFKCIELANKCGDKLNPEGRRSLAIEIIEEMSQSQVDKFVKEFGYE